MNQGNLWYLVAHGRLGVVAQGRGQISVEHVIGVSPVSEQVHFDPMRKERTEGRVVDLPVHRGTISKRGRGH